MEKRFVAGADGKNQNEWFVYDNESCSCHAGPMSESAALHLASDLNNQEDEKARAKAPGLLNAIKTVALGWLNNLGHVSTVTISADGVDQKEIGLMINGELFTAERILKMQRNLQELGSVDTGYEAGFKRGYWWGFENSRCSSGQSNILASYTDVMGLRQRNAAHIAHLKGRQNCATQKN